MNRHYNKIGFQGKKDAIHDDYFEGWYYKQVSKNGLYTISFIPGISYNILDPHCFIQCIISDKNKTLTSHYFKYDVNQFNCQDNPFKVTINNTIFEENNIYIDLKEADINIKGELHFNQLEPLNNSLLCPNIMGYFSYIPKMECNHHIISMNHTIKGSLNIKGEEIDFNDGLGYMEKDWGKSFPKEYIWLQCNHFSKSDIKLALSVATIPFLGFSFKGFFCSLFIDNKEYRFATYNRSKLKFNILKDNQIDITFIKGDIEVNVSSTIDSVLSLASPKNGVMNDFIKEGLSANILLKFSNKQNGKKIEAVGQNAGIEIMMKSW
ncbi:MAG: tocopherol cyclase family protein [Pleomorphochaeta sp.]